MCNPCIFIIILLLSSVSVFYLCYDPGIVWLVNHVSYFSEGLRNGSLPLPAKCQWKAVEKLTHIRWPCVKYTHSLGWRWHLKRFLFMSSKGWMLVEFRELFNHESNMVLERKTEVMQVCRALMIALLRKKNKLSDVTFWTDQNDRWWHCRSG